MCDTDKFTLFIVWHVKDINILIYLDHRKFNNLYPLFLTCYETHYLSYWNDVQFYKFMYDTLLYLHEANKVFYCLKHYVS